MKSESIASLAQALSKAQAEMPAAKMSSTNPFLKNKYADLGEIIQAARVPLAKNGLSFTQLLSSEAGQIVVETILMHQSGEYIGERIGLTLSDEKGRSLAQNAGSVVTYLRRYSLAAILGIYADEDTDGGKPLATTKIEKESAPGKPVAEPAKATAITLEEAVAMTTPKGATFGSLSDEQLKLVAEKGANGAQDAAKYLLDKAQGDDWQTWYHLVDRAGSEKKIFPEDLPDTISRIALYRACVELKKAVEA